MLEASVDEASVGQSPRNRGLQVGTGTCRRFRIPRRHLRGVGLGLPGRLLSTGPRAWLPCRHDLPGPTATGPSHRYANLVTAWLSTGYGPPPCTSVTCRLRGRFSGPRVGCRWLRSDDRVVGSPLWKSLACPPWCRRCWLSADVFLESTVPGKCKIMLAGDCVNCLLVGPNCPLPPLLLVLESARRPRGS